MSTPAYFIAHAERRIFFGRVAGDTCSAIEDLEVTEEVEHENLANAVSRRLTESGYRGEPVVLGLPSSWCLSASIETGDLPTRNRRKAMAYRLEDKLPVSLEDITLDFIESSNEALGIAVETERVRWLVEALEEARVSVEYVVPTALLGLQESIAPGKEGSTVLAEGCGPVALTDGSRTDLFTFDSGLLRSWRLVPSDERALRTCHVLEAMAKGEDPERVENPVALPRESTNGTGGLELATRAAGRIVSGERSPYVNLRRGSLAANDRWRRVRGPLRAVAFGWVLFSLFFGGALFLRSSAHEDRRGKALADLEVLFQETFPGQSVPTSIRRRFESRLRDLEGVSGQVQSGVAAAQGSAFELLLDCLERLPRDQRFLLLEARVSPEDAYFVGHARSHSEADGFSAALRRDGRFAVESPRTEKLPERGVSFRLRARAVKGEGSDR